MKTKVIDLKPVFLMSNQDFIKSIQKCFDILNVVLKIKSLVSHNPLFIKEKNGKIYVGYKPLSKGKTHFFSNEFINPEYDLATRIAIVQLAIFEECKEYDCYKEVPMHGAPEEGTDTFFKFVLNNTEYTYKLWYA